MRNLFVCVVSNSSWWGALLAHIKWRNTSLLYSYIYFSLQTLVCCSRASAFITAPLSSTGPQFTQIWRHRQCVHVHKKTWIAHPTSCSLWCVLLCRAKVSEIYILDSGELYFETYKTLINIGSLVWLKTYIKINGTIIWWKKTFPSIWPANEMWSLINLSIKECNGTLY